MTDAVFYGVDRADSKVLLCTSFVCVCVLYMLGCVLTGHQEELPVLKANGDS